MTGEAIILGRLTLQPHRQLLDGDAAVPLGGKALDLISTLAEARGQLVTKDELMAAVWPGVVVEENAIQVHMSAVRKALASEAWRLSTVRGKGYRIETGLHADAQSVADAVAVLPFANLTGDQGKAYLADGLAEELIANLSRFTSLRVPARTSSFAYRDRAVDVRTIGRELGVGFVVEGSIREAGGRLRVTVQLIEVASGFHRWAGNFERDLGDLLALQDALAEAIGRVLEAKMSANTARTHDPEAYDLHLRGRALAGQVTTGSVLRAIELQTLAVARDPLFAAAWTGLAGTLTVATAIGAIPLDRRHEARARAEEAIRLDRSDAAPYAIRAILDASAGRWSDAAAGFRDAVELDPDQPTVLEAMAINILGPAGRLGEAVVLAERAVALAPGAHHLRVSAAFLKLCAGDLRSARRDVDLAVSLGAPDNRMTVMILRGEMLRAEGRLEEAADLLVAAFSQMQPVRDAGVERVVRESFAAQADAGWRASAGQAITSFIDALDADDGLWRFHGVGSHATLWQTLLGDLDAAFAIQERLLRAWRRSGHLTPIGFSHLWRSEMAPLRRDPRFASLIERFGLADQAGPQTIRGAIAIGRGGAEAA